MVIFRALVLISLTAAILGGTAFFAYELYWKPRQLDLEDKREFRSGTPSPPPDFSLPAFDKALALQKSGDREGFRNALTEFVANYADSPNLAKAKTLLGDLNSESVFSPAVTANKTPYTVSHGDSLAKISSKTKTSAELIYRANNLDSINLSIGQQLLVPHVEMRLVVDRKAETLTLYNKGAFFKEYKVMHLKTPGLPASKPVETKVAEKIALKDSNRVAFGDKNYSEAERWVMLSTSAIAIRAQLEGAAPPPGIAVSPADLEEIFLLVSRGTPVTIN
jgi:LysM repeat protein